VSPRPDRGGAPRSRAHIARRARHETVRLCTADPRRLPHRHEGLGEGPTRARKPRIAEARTSSHSKERRLPLHLVDQPPSGSQPHRRLRAEDQGIRRFEIGSGDRSRSRRNDAVNRPLKEGPGGVGRTPEPGDQSVARQFREDRWAIGISVPMAKCPGPEDTRNLGSENRYSATSMETRRVANDAPVGSLTQRPPRCGGPHPRKGRRGYDGGSEGRDETRVRQGPGAAPRTPSPTRESGRGAWPGRRVSS